MLPDRRDLNRGFPGNRTGSTASQIAFNLFDRVIRHCEFLVDLHTGSNDRANLPQDPLDELIGAEVPRLHEDRPEAFALREAGDRPLEVVEPDLPIAKEHLAEAVVRVGRGVLRVRVGQQSHRLLRHVLGSSRRPHLRRHCGLSFDGVVRWRRESGGPGQGTVIRRVEGSRGIRHRSVRCGIAFSSGVH